MNKKLEYKGLWFLPSSEDDKVAGVLTYTPNEKITLELIGTFKSSANEVILSFFGKTETLDIIWGIDSNANKITLINCYEKGSSYHSNSTFPIMKYSAQYILEGIHLSSKNEESFNLVSVRISALSLWCHPALIEKSHCFQKQLRQTTCSFNLTDKNRLIKSVILNDNTTLELKRRVGYSNSENGMVTSLEQETYLEIIKKKEVNFFDLLKDVLLFEEFLSLAGLLVVKAENITLFNDGDYIESANGKMYSPIKLFYTQTNITHKLGRHNFLFTFEQIENNFSSIISNWYNETLKISPIRTHLVESVKIKKTFTSVDFLIVIQAIEGFCYRFKKAQSIRCGLEEILKEFDDIVKVKDGQIDVDNVVHSRHYYSHFMNKSKKPKALDGVALYELTDKLRILLVCCLLHFIGLKNSEINEILNKSQNNFLQM